MKVYNVFPVTRFDGTTALILGEGSQQVIVPCAAGSDGLTVDYRHAPPQLVAARSGPGWIARICTRGGGKGAGNGYVSVLPEHEDHVFVVAHAGGQHDPKGKASSWHDYVLVIEDGTLLRVKNAGEQAFFLYFGSAEVKQVPTTYAAALGKQLGLTLPENCSHYRMLPRPDEV